MFSERAKNGAMAIWFLVIAAAGVEAFTIVVIVGWKLVRNFAR